MGAICVHPGHCVKSFGKARDDTEGAWSKRQISGGWIAISVIAVEWRA
jgi:hypothetical protein